MRIRNIFFNGSESHSSFAKSTDPASRHLFVSVYFFIIWLIRICCVRKCELLCPRSSDPFHIVSYFMKWVTTSWILLTMVLLRKYTRRTADYREIYLYILLTHSVGLGDMHNKLPTRGIRNGFGYFISKSLKLG